MVTVIYKTENAMFEFDRQDVIDRLNILSAKYDLGEEAELLKILSISIDEKILFLKRTTILDILPWI